MIVKVCKVCLSLKSSRCVTYLWVHVATVLGTRCLHAKRVQLPAKRTPRLHFAEQALMGLSRL